ncbi:MAG TPA: glycoside hydrolase family 38 C-terminal domain-containing protein [Solirubrobacteraceae bacterium]|jgi:alpha-mannosidase|nr:glycoside hydrolase family 38 C-terminal domain-containing protein [Solirubrobacteraceae bacterium]
MLGGADQRARRFFVVPHTHWDREWYAPFEHFRLALGRVVDGVLDVLEGDSAFTSFTLDGQAIVLEDYVEVRPENEARLRALIAAGRIEVGPSYVLPDEFLVGAEPLVRNLLIGRAVCERFGAEPTPVGYLPDSFGHPAQLPQILAGFGIDTFIFSRGMGDELDEVGVVFRWRAPDGSEVLALQQLADYSNFAWVFDAEEGERRVRGVVERFGERLARAQVDDVLLCNGSDHLPVTPQLPSLCAELEQRLPGSTFAISRYVDYVRAVGAPQVPTFSGELLGSRLQNVLRGVNSARLYVKRANERAEQRLLATETLAALRALHDGSPFPTADFRVAWRELLRCHPHDTICGCSCDEVHADALARYESLHRLLGELEGDGEALSAVNVLPFRRRGLIERPGAEPTLVELDGFAAAPVQLAPACAPAPRAGTAIECDELRVEAAPDGTFTVIDKRSGRRSERLHQLEDEPDLGDLYNFCPDPDVPITRGEPASARVLRDGPLIFELEIAVPALGVTTVVRLVRGSGRVELRTSIENTRPDHRLRVVFPTDAPSGPVRADGQFAVLRRGVGAATPRADWVEPPDGTGHVTGVVAAGLTAVLTKGLPEYEARVAGGRVELCLTLLRCVGLISRPSEAIATRPHGAGPATSTPGGQCLGRQECEYALLIGADALDDVALLREAQDYRSPWALVAGPVPSEPPLALEGGLVFSCLKGAEDGDGLILRCFNPTGSTASARLSGALEAWETRLDETGERALPSGVLELGAGAIGTWRLRRR